MAEQEQSSRTVEIIVAVCFGAAIAGAAGFALGYWVDAGTHVEGIAAAATLFAIALGLGVWANGTLERAEVTQQREPLGSTDEEREDVMAGFERGEHRVQRRTLLAGLAGSALVSAGLAAIFPFRSLGPRPHNMLRETAWRKGTRVVSESGKTIRPSDVSTETALTVFPEGVTDTAKRTAAQTVLINLGDASRSAESKHPDWMVQNTVAYSRVCTHAGCPVGVYRPETHQLMCPCHQSLFNALDSAKPVFGPASRPLPQLPLGVDADGNLVARGDFEEPIGPGFWDR